MRGSRKVVAMAAVGCIGLAALGTGVAVGGKGLKTKTQATTVEPTTVSSATAKCKRGTKAVSGGFASNHVIGSDEFGSLIPQQSSRQGARRWVAAAYNLGLNPGELTAFAHCRDEKLKRRSASIAIEPGEGGTASAKCPKGTRLLSGGFEGGEGPPDTPRFWITTSRKLGPRTWTVSASNTGGAEGELVAYAYCREGSKLQTAQVSDTVNLDDYPTNADADMAPTCKRRQRVVSGGWASNDDQIAAAFRASHRLDPRTWRIRATAQGIFGTDVTAYAYCEKKQRKK
jgi:hypothetical protein